MTCAVKFGVEVQAKWMMLAVLHKRSFVSGWRGWWAWPPRSAYCMLTEAFCYERNAMSVCAFTKRDSDTEKERKDTPASLHSVHFRSGCTIQGDSREQGEPDRNNTINQTSLSLKSLFLWVANLLLTSWQLIEKNWWPTTWAATSLHPAHGQKLTIWPPFHADGVGKKHSSNTMWSGVEVLLCASI